MTKVNKTGFLNALGALIYIALVVLVMQNGDKLFGQMSNYIGPVAFLLMFVLSAVVVGGLIIGKPIMFYLDGKKKEAISLFLSTAVWIAGFTVLALLLAFLLK